MKNENYEHLKLEERQIIYKMHGEGKTEQEISKEVRRAKSTISRELKRNQSNRALRRHLTALELAYIAHQKAILRRSESKKGERSSIKLALVRDHIVECLKDRKWSPEDISISIKTVLGVSVSAKTIRRWIYSDAKELKTSLTYKGKKRNKRIAPKRKRNSDGSYRRSIHEREEIINDRRRVGDYEADLIVCSQSRVCILSVRERKTRECWLRLLPNSESETVRGGLIGIFANILPTLLHTCTFDNGSEFAKVYEVEKLLGIKSYWCDAYCSWQKGSVEQQNREVRRHFPKTTDLSQITKEQLKLVEFYINDKPRACLNGLSSEELWQSALFKARSLLH